MSEQVLQNLLQKNKNTKDGKDVAMVTSVRWKYSGSDYDEEDDWGSKGLCFCKVAAYSPKLKRTIRIDEDLFAGQSEKDLIASCVVGDIISYEINLTEDEYGTPKNIYEIVRNFSLEQRLNTFKKTYDKVYGNIK